MGAPLLLIAAALAQAAPTAEPAPAWRTIHTVEGAAYALDPASVRREGDKVQARLRASAARPLADGTSAVVAEIELDCAARTATLIRRAAFGADGRLLAALDVPAGERRARLLGGEAADAAIERSLCGAPLDPGAE